MLKKARLLLCLGLLVHAAWAAGDASLAGSAPASATTAGTLDLSLGADGDGAYAFTSVDLSNMMPGDVRYEPVIVANSGTLSFTYTMSTLATDADGKHLAAQLTLGIKKVPDGRSCDRDGVGYAASPEIITAEGPLNLAGITRRSLVAGDHEVVCFRVEFPSTAGDAYQGATTSATFTFSAS